MAGVLVMPAGAQRRPPDALRLKFTDHLSLPAVTPPASVGVTSQDVPGQPAPAQPPVPQVSSFALDASLDVTQRHGASQDVAVTWAPVDGVDESGFRVRLAGNRSTYSYPSDETRRDFVHGESRQLDALIGGTWLGERVSFTVMAGRAWSRAKEGVLPVMAQSTNKVAASVFAAPTSGTRLFSAVSYTRVSDYTQLFAKQGWTLPSGAFCGPEAKVDWRGHAPWRAAPQAWRLGGHLSGMAWLGASWSLGVGRVQDDNQGVGAYLGLGVYGSY
jgi:Cellulose biosynthesis protein BcsS